MNYQLSDFVTSIGEASQLFYSEKQEIVFCGKSNVGKSSLINKLLNKKGIARVSSSPGKTATINVYSVDNILFMDLPGYGYARKSFDEREKWKELINEYLEQERNIKLFLQLIDSRHPPSEKDLQMLEYLQGRNLPYFIVLTKCDKISSTELKIRVESTNALHQNNNVISVSSSKGTGIEQLKSVIESSVI